MRNLLTQGAVFSLGLMVAALSPAWAQKAPKPAKAAASAAAPASSAVTKVTPGPPVLSREELRACRTQQAKVLELQKGLDTEQASIAVMHDDIEKRSELLKQKVETVDRTKQEAIDAYNAEIKDRQKLVDEFDARVTAFNARVASAHDESDTFSDNCKDRKFLDSDAKALDEGK